MTPNQHTKPSCSPLNPTALQGCRVPQGLFYFPNAKAERPHRGTPPSRPKQQKETKDSTDRAATPLSQEHRSARARAEGRDERSFPRGARPPELKEARLSNTRCGFVLFPALDPTPPSLLPAPAAPSAAASPPQQRGRRRRAAPAGPRPVQPAPAAPRRPEYPAVLLPLPAAPADPQSRPPLGRSVPHRPLLSEPLFVHRLPQRSLLPARPSRACW